MDSSHLSLKNIDIYMENMEVSLKDVYICLKQMFEQYIKCCLDANNKIDKYYIDKGINIIVNVFKIILMYTKNLDIAKKYAFNSIYYYIEYINQITNTDTEIVFINLTLNDAILYVYRKSIYEISDSYKKKFKLNADDNSKFNKIGELVLSYQSMYSTYFNTVTNINELEPKVLIKINTFFETLFNKKQLNYSDKLNILSKLSSNHSNIFEYNKNTDIIIDDIINKMNNIIK